MKELVKKILPSPMKEWVTRLLREQRARGVRRVNAQVQSRYQSLDLAGTFNQIYTEREWGVDRDGILNSGKGSTGRFIDEYCLLLENLFKKYGVQSVADLGCGNFNTGQRVARLVTQYTGIDIARPVIDANNRAFSSERVRFVCADMTKDPLPPAQAGIIRQVLQHLSNAEIHAALCNVLRVYGLLIVTEHLYVGRGARPNIDFGHGPGTRVPMKSGVFLDQPPYQLRTIHAGDIHYDVPDEVLRTWVVQA